MSAAQYTIHELFDPTDNRYWKLHWFMELTMNQKTTESLIEALFVPLVRNDLDIDRNPPELLDNDSYDFSEGRIIEVGGGQLPVLHIGLLLHQGRPAKRPRYQRKFFDLSITEGTTRIFPLKHSHKTGPGSWAYDIEFDEYNLYGTNLFVRCLHIDVPPGRYDRITKLIIPSAELIRLGYGNSSELFQEILTNGLAGSPNRVFDPSRTVLPNNKEGKTPFLQLSEYVKPQDAPIVARFVFSRYALSQAKRIYLSTDFNSKHPYRGRGSEPQGRVPEVTLPYINQETRLIVRGKTIRSGKDRYFLVYHIESDSAQFPFQYFEFGQDGDANIHFVTDQGLPDAGRSTSVEKEKVLIVNDEVEEFIIRSDKEPSRVKEQVEELLWQDKFPDLNKKKWRKRGGGDPRKRPPRQEPRFIQGHDDTEEFSTAPRGSGENKVTPLSFMVDFEGEGEKVTEQVPVDGPVGEEKPKEGKLRRVVSHGAALRASYDLFKQLVNMLDEVLPEKLHCEFVKVPKSGEEKTFGRPLLSSFPTKRRNLPIPWSTVTRDGETRARYVAAARGVCHGERYFYLLEIEPPEWDEEKEREARRLGKEYRGPRTFTLLLIGDDRRNFADISAENLREVLALCAQKGGSWLKKGELEGFGRKKFKHASKFEKAFVARIIKHLLEVNLLTLGKAEVEELLQRLKSIKADEPSQADEAAQSDEQSQATESVESITSSECSESSQSLEMNVISQADQPTAIEVSSEASESSETNEPSESPEPSAVVTLDAEPSYEESLVGV